MSVPEAVSGYQPPSTSLGWTVGTAVLAVVIWASAIVCAIVDATVYDLPDPMISGQFAIASLLTVAALLMHFAFRRASSSPLAGVAQGQAELVAAVAELAKQVEQLSAKQGAVDNAFEYGRRYQQATNGSGPDLRIVPGEN